MTALLALPGVRDAEIVGLQADAVETAVAAFVVAAHMAEDHDAGLAHRAQHAQGVTLHVDDAGAVRDVGRAAMAVCAWRVWRRRAQARSVCVCACVCVLRGVASPRRQALRPGCASHTLAVGVGRWHRL